MTKCKLCLEEKELSKSHIIPEFFYKSMYDSKHRMIILSNIKSEPVKYRYQGIYEKLLCKECEAKINRYENYIIEKLTNAGHFEDDRVIIYTNIEFLHFRLFALSVLWRASISTNRMFQDVDLGKNEETIRKMVLNNNPGQYDLFPILMAAIMTKNKQSVKDLVTNPDLIKVLECWAYRLVFGGFVWLFLFGDSSEFALRNLFFQPQGSIIIPKKDMEDVEFIVQFGFDLHW